MLLNEWCVHHVLPPQKLVLFLFLQFFTQKPTNNNQWYFQTRDRTEEGEERETHQDTPGGMLPPSTWLRVWRWSTRPTGAGDAAGDARSKPAEDEDDCCARHLATMDARCPTAARSAHDRNSGDSTAQRSALMTVDRKTGHHECIMGGRWVTKK